MERASIWFTGNWRLGDPAAVAARPDVSSPAEMATVLIEEFNSLVEPGDIVWMLGGMFGDAQAGIEPDLDAVGLLHGRKYLIAGPGDHCWFAHPGSMTWTQRYRDAGLAGVVTGAALARVQQRGRTTARVGLPIRLPVGPLRTPVNLAHFPYAAQGQHGTQVQRPVRDPKAAAQWLVHGAPPEGDPDQWGLRQFPVDVDTWEMQPVPARIVTEHITHSLEDGS